MLTGGFDAAGLKAGFEGVDMSIIMGIVMGLGL